MSLHFSEDLRNTFPSLKQKIYESSKIWHKLYPYKITLDSYVELSTVWYWLGATYSIPKPEVNSKFRVRHSKQITIYFTDYNDFKTAVDFFKDAIISIHVLLSQEAKKILNDDRKIRVKKQLYFRQYRHKVLFRHSWLIGQDTITEMKKWSKDIFDFDLNEIHELHYTYRNDRAWFRWNQQEPTLFLANEDDVTLAKLAYGEYFETIETIRLIKELERKL